MNSARQILDQQPKTKKIWKIMLVVQIIGLISAVIMLPFFFYTNTDNSSTGVERFVAHQAIVLVIVSIILWVLGVWALIKLKFWFRWVYWALAVINFIGANAIGIIFAIFMAIGYGYIIKKIKTATTPSHNPIAPNQSLH